MTETVDRARVFGERPEAVERIAPGFFWPDLESEHLARYRWASRWVRGRRVLDVACGTGYGAPILRTAGARNVVSLDVSHDALRFGRPRYDLTPVLTDAHQLPLADSSFEIVVSLETIEHLKNPRGFIGEIHRVLRPGGELLLSSPNAERSAGKNPYHINELTLGEFQRLFAERGLALLGVWGQHWRPGFRLLEAVRGLRRVFYEIHKSPRVTPWLPVGLTPLYLCLRAVRA